MALYVLRQGGKCFLERLAKKEICWFVIIFLTFVVTGESIIFPVFCCSIIADIVATPGPGIEQSSASSQSKSRSESLAWLNSYVVRKQDGLPPSSKISSFSESGSGFVCSKGSLYFSELTLLGVEVSNRGLKTSVDLSV